MMKLYKVKFESIEMLPFGSLINTNLKYNLNSNKFFLISIAGIVMQLILYVVFYLLFKYNFINDISYNIFLMYNKLIILFNIIPMIPLDGSKILLSIIERFIPYKLSLTIINVISLISIVTFIIFSDKNLNLILISTFIFMKTYTEIFEHNYIFIRFLVERYLYDNKNKKIKMIKNIKNIYKNKYNFIKGESEEKYLIKVFDKGRYFWYYLFVCNEFINRTKKVKSWLITP